MTRRSGKEKKCKCKGTSGRERDGQLGIITHRHRHILASSLFSHFHQGGSHFWGNLQGFHHDSSSLSPPPFPFHRPCLFPSIFWTPVAHPFPLYYPLRRHTGLIYVAISLFLLSDKPCLLTEFFSSKKQLLIIPCMN